MHHTHIPMHRQIEGIKMKRWLMDARVPLGMLAVQIILTGLQLLYRVILSEGTFIFALLTYRHIVAAICIAPFALYWENKDVVKKLSSVALCWLFMVALTGIIMAMGLFYYGLKDTTATYVTNMLNLIPVVTFLFSTILSLIGMALIIVGLYSFLWGKNEELKKRSTGQLPVKIETEGGRVVDGAAAEESVSPAAVAPAVSPNIK